MYTLLSGHMSRLFFAEINENPKSYFEQSGCTCIQVGDVFVFTSFFPGTHSA